MRAGATQSSPTAYADIRIIVSGDTYASIDIGAETARLISAYEDEMVWGGVYHFYLDNSDEALNAKDYKGKTVVVNHGFIGSAGSDIGDLWVDDQEFISREGKLLLHLTCIDAWGLLSRVRGTVGGAYWNFPWQDSDKLAELALPVSGKPLPATLVAAITAHFSKTVQQIVTTTISNALGMTVDLDDNDGYTTTEKPQVSAMDARSVVAQAMGVTESYLLWKTDGKFHIIEPGAHAVVYSYNVANLFFNNTEEQALVIPNRIIYWFINKVDPDDPDTWLWAHSDYGAGTGVDAASYAVLGIYIDEHHNLEQELWEGIANQAEADARAAARLLHLQLQKATGTLVAPMHCAQELFDKITIVDDRYDTPKTITGYVFRIIREYDRGVYRITLQLGGVETGYTPDDGEAVRITPRTITIPIPPTNAWQIPPGEQAYIADIDFTSVDYNHISWTAGNVKLADGRIQAITDTGSPLTLTATHYLYVIWGNSTLQSSTTYSDAIGSDRMLVAVASIGSSAAVSAYVLNPHTDSILINTDKVMDGLVTELKLAAEAVTEAKIAASAVTEGKIAALSVTAGKIAALAVIAEKIAASAVTSDKINAGAVTAIKIDVATLDAISANVGTLTSGIINGVVIYAGGGAVVLDATGLDIKGQTLKFRHTDGVLAGRMHGIGGALTIVTETGKNLDLYAGAGAYIRVNSLNPIGAGSLGVTGTRWSYGFINRVYANTRAVAPVGTNRYD